MHDLIKRCIGLFWVVLLAACNTAGSPPASTAFERRNHEGKEITVAAASDLQFAFTDIAGLFEQETGAKVTLVFGSTGQLVQQIENGAPYDLIAAANIDFVQRLEDQKLVLPETVALYAQGRIVLAVNNSTGVTASQLEELLSPSIRHISIANPEHAPYGLAAKQALESAGIWDAILPKLVYAENVRQAMQYVQSGDAEVGIISLPVANVPELSWHLVDASLHAPLNQALAVVASSDHPELALDFAEYINNEKGRAVMRSYGFILPGETPELGINP